MSDFLPFHFPSPSLYCVWHYHLKWVLHLSLFFFHSFPHYLFQSPFNDSLVHQSHTSFCSLFSPLQSLVSAYLSIICPSASFSPPNLLLPSLKYNKPRFFPEPAEENRTIISLFVVFLFIFCPLVSLTHLTLFPCCCTSLFTILKVRHAVF